MGELWAKISLDLLLQKAYIVLKTKDLHKRFKAHEDETGPQTFMNKTAVCYPLVSKGTICHHSECLIKSNYCRSFYCWFHQYCKPSTDS